MATGHERVGARAIGDSVVVDPAESFALPANTSRSIASLVWSLASDDRVCGACLRYLRRRTRAAIGETRRQRCGFRIRLLTRSFYLGVAGALWILVPEVLRSNRYWFILLFGLEGFRYVFDFLKYRKTASYHSYLAKLWGIVLAVTIIGVFAFSGSEFLVRTALGIGIAVNVEGLAMSLMLPRWKNDVKTLRAAWRLRKSMLGEQAPPHITAE